MDHTVTLTIGMSRRQTFMSIKINGNMSFNTKNMGITYNVDAFQILVPGEGKAPTRPLLTTSL